MINYYRVVYYDKNNIFENFEVIEVRDKIDLISKINKHYPLPIEIYKCNKNGNNYTGRMVYPILQIRDDIGEAIAE